MMTDFKTFLWKKLRELFQVRQDLFRREIAIQSATRFMIYTLVFNCIVLTGFTGVHAGVGYGQALTQVSQPSRAAVEVGVLESFTDELVPRQLADYHIAGAIVTIVKNGKVELSKGYGYANVARQTLVTPDETLFRIGSTSKLVTWTAVMQVVEQGKIDLRADVNTYLTDFKIPDTFPEPITMLNLLSHTAGFEERATGTESPTPSEMLSLHDYLAHYMPDRVRPAGELITYSNYGTALAGYIVEAVSGVPFEQYVETKIFEPLSMSHSTFRQPLPSQLKSLLADSYSYHGEFVPGTFTYPNLLPAATMCSTAHDMANFITAHLQAGRFGESQILKPETAHLMHSRLFSNDVRLDGVAYGFLEWNFNGQRVLWHNGDIGNWHSGLAIIPEENLGFFVAYNSMESVPAVAEFYSAFANAFFPAQETREQISATSSSPNTEDLAGEYRSTRTVYNHVERILSFPGNGNVSVTVNPDRTLSISGQTLYETEPFVFRTPDWTDTVIFQRDGRGKITRFLVNSNQLFSYERISWYETSTFNLLAFGVCYGLLLTAPLAALIGVFKRRKKGSPDSRMPGIARVWALLVSVVFLLVPAAITLYSNVDYKSPFPSYMMVVLATIMAASILVVGPVIFAIFAWVRKFWSRAGRIHYTLITAALLGMVWLMEYWRLLGFRF